MNTQLLLWLDVIGSALVIGTFIIGVIKWGKRIAGAISGWIDRVGDNTTATEQLTGVVADVRNDIREIVTVVRVHTERLDEHDKRLDTLESR